MDGLSTDTALDCTMEYDDMPRAQSKRDRDEAEETVKNAKKLRIEQDQAYLSGKIADQLRKGMRMESQRAAQSAAANAVHASESAKACVSHMSSFIAAIIRPGPDSLEELRRRRMLHFEPLCHHTVVGK